MFTKEFFKKSLFILLGTFIISISINGLFIPNKILGGGITGIAILLHLILNLNISLVIILLNIPIFILGYIYINKSFVFYSLLGMLSLSCFLALTSNIHIETNNILTTILLGGTINGLGTGLVFRENGSCGGSDIISKILNKYFSFSIPTTNFIINIFVILMSVYFFNLDLAVFTLAAMFVSTSVIKYVLEGLNYKRSVFIISNNDKEITKAIMAKLNRGVTIIHGNGAYTGNNKNILFCVIGTKQLSKLKFIVREIDPNAFITVTETSQVFGNGTGFYNISST